MFMIYLIQNDGIGTFGTATCEEWDLTWQPSECFWLVPGTEDEDG